jgi:hypothetical protein
MRFITIQSPRYSILSNLPLLFFGVLFVLSVASPLKNLSQGPFLAAVASFRLFKVKIMLDGEGNFLIERLRAKTTCIKTPVLTIIV